MKIKVGDNVRVITGSNKGKEGKVLKVLRNENRVLVDGVNVVKKHIKPNGQDQTGGILSVCLPVAFRDGSMRGYSMLSVGIPRLKFRFQA